MKRNTFSAGGCGENVSSHRTGDAADVGERVDAADAGPHDVAGRDQVALAVERRLHFSAENVVRLLERVVVQADADAGLVLDEEHAVMARAQRARRSSTSGTRPGGRRPVASGFRSVSLADGGIWLTSK